MSGVLEKFPEHQVFSDNSVTKCKNHCADLEYGMSAVFTTDCYCWFQRNEYLSTKAIMGLCNAPCPGNSSEVCGKEVALKYAYVADTDFPGLRAHSNKNQ